MTRKDDYHVVNSLFVFKQHFSRCWCSTQPILNIILAGSWFLSFQFLTNIKLRCVNVAIEMTSTLTKLKVMNLLKLNVTDKIVSAWSCSDVEPPLNLVSDLCHHKSHNANICCIQQIWTHILYIYSHCFYFVTNLYSTFVLHCYIRLHLLQS